MDNHSLTLGPKKKRTQNNQGAHTKLCCRQNSRYGNLKKQEKANLHVFSERNSEATGLISLPFRSPACTSKDPHRQETRTGDGINSDDMKSGTTQGVEVGCESGSPKKEEE